MTPPYSRVSAGIQLVTNNRDHNPLFKHHEWSGVGEASAGDYTEFLGFWLVKNMLSENTSFSMSVACLVYELGWLKREKKKMKNFMGGLGVT